MRLVNLSALWRINLWVTFCFALVALACAGVLLHQAVADVELPNTTRQACNPG